MRQIKITLSDRIGGYCTEISEKILMADFVQMRDNTDVLNKILYSLERELNADLEEK